MTKLMDLPDDIITTILSQFKLSGQRSRYLRRADETYYDVLLDDTVKRADLAALAQVCKRLCSLANPLLYESRYLHLDMLRSSAATIEENLALLSNARSLHHLVCALKGCRTKNFFICLFNAPTLATLRSLSVSFYSGSGTGSIDMRCLSRLPNLLGLELRSDGDWHITLPPPASLPALKELHVKSGGSIVQLRDILALAAPSTLENLDIEYAPDQDVHVDAALWTQLLGDKLFPHVHSLTITFWLPVALSAEILAEAPKYFPSLRSLHQKIGFLETDYRAALSNSLPTALTFSPQNPRRLEALLLSVSEDIKPISKLQKIRINMDDIPIADGRADGWGPPSASDLVRFSSNAIQLARNAGSVARAHGIDLRPLNLVNQIEVRQRREIEVLQHLEQQQAHAAGWQAQPPWGQAPPTWGS